MKKVVILFVVVSILTSCAKTIFIMPDYQNKKIEGKSLVIADVNILVSNPMDVTDDLGDGNPKKVYKDFLTLNLTGRLSQFSTFNKVNFVAVTNKEDFSERVLEIDKDEKIYMNLPNNGQVVTTDSIYGDFVLFLQDFQVLRKSGEGIAPNAVFMSSPGGGGSWMVSGGGGSVPDLRTMFNFVIWDNNEKRIVSYGKVDCPTPFAFAMTHKTWVSSISNISEKMLEGTPFENFPREIEFDQYGREIIE